MNMLVDTIDTTMWLDEETIDLASKSARAVHFEPGKWPGQGDRSDLKYPEIKRWEDESDLLWELILMETVTGGEEDTCL